jgi:hypothetical protein
MAASSSTSVTGASKEDTSAEDREGRVTEDRKEEQASEEKEGAVYARVK